MLAVRARATRTRSGRLAWRSGVAFVGTVVLLAGIVMIPGPGQGWATVFLGLAILSTEFRWARRLRERAWSQLVATRDRYQASSRSVRVAVVLVTATVCVGALAAVAWGSLAVAGVPGWVPDLVSDPLDVLPGVQTDGDA